MGHPDWPWSEFKSSGLVSIKLENIRDGVWYCTQGNDTKKYADRWLEEAVSFHGYHWCLRGEEEDCGHEDANPDGEWVIVRKCDLDPAFNALGEVCP